MPNQVPEAQIPSVFSDAAGLHQAGGNGYPDRMALDNPRDLFLFELSAMRDAERTGGLLLGSLIGGRVRNNDLEQVLRAQAKDSEDQLRNINSCFQAFGISTTETLSTTVEGIREGFETFLSLAPTAPVQDLFAVGTALRFTYFAIANYRSLVGWAVLMDENRCAQTLQTNLYQKEESAGDLERIGHEMSAQLLTA